jgi:uncharacterized protein YbjT (DUF2867 family)
VYVVTTTRNASISWVQRQLRIGYNRAARLVEEMEKQGVVSPPEHNGDRTVLADIAASIGLDRNAYLAALDDPATSGRVYELGGPRVLTLREILAYIVAQTGRRRALARIPFRVAEMLGAVLEKLPAPQLTRDQVKLLRRDNVVSAGAADLRSLNIEPTPIEAVVPQYLEIYRRGGRFASTSGARSR